MNGDPVFSPLGGMSSRVFGGAADYLATCGGGIRVGAANETAKPEGGLPGKDAACQATVEMSTVLLFLMFLGFPAFPTRPVLRIGHRCSG